MRSTMRVRSPESTNCREVETHSSAIKAQPDQSIVVSRGQAGKIYEVQIWCG
jgi:hypothetical protein